MFLFFWNFLQQVMFAFFFEADYLPIVLLKLLFLLYLELQHNQLVLLVQLHVCKYNSSGFDYNCKHEIIVVVLTSGSFWIFTGLFFCYCFQLQLVHILHYPPPVQYQLPHCPVQYHFPHRPVPKQMIKSYYFQLIS